MRKRHFPFLLFAILLLSLQVLAQTGPTIFVSNFTGGQILSVDGTTGATKAIFSGKSKFRPEDMTVGPDRKLYVCAPENNQIIRMDKDGKNAEIVYQAVADPLTPQGPRFDPSGSLLFNTKAPSHSGVWKIPGLASIPTGGPFPPPVQVLTATQLGSSSGEGLAFAINGDLLIVDRFNNRVLRSPAPLFNSAAPLISTGLNDPIGIAVNSKGEILVAVAGASGKVIRCDADGAGCIDFVLFPDRPIYLEAVLDNTVFVATADAANLNGQVWRVDRFGNKVLLTILPKRKGKFPPAWGVAVPATSKTITKTFGVGNETQNYNWGSFAFEVTNAATGGGNCTMEVTATETNPAEVVAEATSNGILDVSAVTPSGSEGRAIVFTAEQPDCFVGDSFIYIAAFLPQNFGVNIRLLRNFSVFEQSFGYYTLGIIEGDPDDAGSLSRVPVFGSDLTLVDRELAEDGNYCGIKPPLSEDPDNVAVFNPGQNITWGYQLTTGDNCTGDFITDAEAILAVAQIEDEFGNPVFVRKVVTPPGSANEIPLFRYDFNKNQYLYNLQTKEPDGTDWPRGLYAGTIQSNKFFPREVRFRLE